MCNLDSGPRNAFVYTMAADRIEKMVNGLLPEFYATLEDETRWTGVLDGICAGLEMRSAVAMMIARDRSCPEDQWVSRDSFSLRHAAQHDHMINNAENPRMPKPELTGLPADGLVLLDEDILDRDSGPARAFAARLEQCQLGPAAWISIPVDRNRCFTLILHRRWGDTSNFEREREFLGLMQAHLKRLVRLTTPEDQATLDAFEQATDCLRIGMVLLDENLCIHYMNHAADRIVTGSPYLTTHNGHLHARQPQDRAQLTNLAKQSDVAVLSGGGLCLFKGRNGQELEMRAVPLQRHPSGHGPSIALFLQEPGHLSAPETTEIMSLCGLSPAEAQLAATLTEGFTVSDFATQRGIQEGTARIQLKNALAKTQCSRQSALVGRVLRSVAAQTDYPGRA